MNDGKRAVLLDLDGTLLTGDKRVLPSSVSALRQLREREIETVLISARSPSGIRPILSDIGLRLPMICLGGGYALDEDGVVLFSEGFSPDIANRVTERIDRDFPNVSWNVFSGEKWFVRDTNTPKIQREMKLVRARAEKGSARLLSECEKVHKILLICDPDRLRETETGIREAFPELTVAPSSDILIEVTSGSVSKRSGAEKYLKSRGILPENAAAFGDNENDEDLLCFVGHPFLMENAPEKMCQTGFRVTDSNERDGIWKGLLALGWISPKKKE